MVKRQAVIGSRIDELRPSQAGGRGFESHHPLQSLFQSKIDENPSLALTLEQLLLSILDEKGRRRIMLKSKSNDELFLLYKDELKLRVRSQRNTELFS